MKNLLFAENMLYAAWLGELQSDWSKRLFGSQDFVRYHVGMRELVWTIQIVHTSPHIPTLGQ